VIDRDGLTLVDAGEFPDFALGLLVPPFDFFVVLFRREQLFQYHFIIHGAIMS
jgi:hypothetical protein